MDCLCVGVQKVDAFHEFKDHAFEVNLARNAIPQLLVEGERSQVEINRLADEDNDGLVFEGCLDQVEQAGVPELG